MATLFIFKHINEKLTKDTRVYPGAEANSQSNPTWCMLDTMADILQSAHFKLLTAIIAFGF